MGFFMERKDERRSDDFIKSRGDVAPLAFALAPGAGKMALDLAPGALLLYRNYTNL